MVSPTQLQSSADNSHRATEEGTPAQSFQHLKTPERLWVPCGSQPPLAVGAMKGVGSHVARGEPLLAGAPELEYMPLAPAAGRVVEMNRVTLLDGREAAAAVLETDAAADQPRTNAWPCCDPTALESSAARWTGAAPQGLSAWIDRLRAAGVWANRWTGPDLLRQLDQCLRRPVDTVLCNLLDAAPTLPINRAMAEAFPAELVAAVSLLARLTAAKRVWAAVDESIPAPVWNRLREAAMVGVEEFRLVPLENDYPQPDPTLLLYSLTRRRLAPGALPTERGVLLLDAAAAVAIGRVVLADEPMLSVPLVVYDFERRITHQIAALIGTRLADLLSALAIPTADVELRAGAPLRQIRVGPHHVIAGGELCIHVTPIGVETSPDPCTRCAWCAEGCPVRIQPASILEAAQRGDPHLARRSGIDACIECGVCSYVCPSRLPLLEAIRGLRRKG